MTALEPWGRFDPALGRLPGAVAHALFRGDDWLATSSLSITTALEAAAPNTRIAWACDWAVFRTWALGRAAVWYQDERDRIRLPTRPELLVRFVTDMLGGYDGEQARARATVLRYLSTLSTLHRLLDAPDPTKAPMVRNTVKAKTRGSGGQDQAAPFRWADVLDALAKRLAEQVKTGEARAERYLKRTPSCPVLAYCVITLPAGCLVLSDGVVFRWYKSSLTPEKKICQDFVPSTKR